MIVHSAVCNASNTTLCYNSKDRVLWSWINMTILHRNEVFYYSCYLKTHIA